MAKATTHKDFPVLTQTLKPLFAEAQNVAAEAATHKDFYEMSSPWRRPQDWNIFCWLGLLRALHGCVFNSMALGAEEPACGILCGACQRLKPVYFGCFAARLKACPTRIC